MWCDIDIRWLRETSILEANRSIITTCIKHVTSKFNISNYGK